MNASLLRYAIQRPSLIANLFIQNQFKQQGLHTLLKTRGKMTHVEAKLICNKIDEQTELAKPLAMINRSY